MLNWEGLGMYKCTYTKKLKLNKIYKNKKFKLNIFN